MPGQVEELMTPIGHFGPDGSASRIEENAGLGYLLSFNTPEARYEKQPLTDISGRYVLISRARIDNRDELQKVFDIPHREMATTPDSFFIMEAFLKWGKACVDYLLGDWAFAVWDRAGKELFVARDHHGNTGLVYYRSQDVFIFSSSIKSLLNCSLVSRDINEMFLVKILLSWNPNGGETAYRNIHRLPPSHYLSVSQTSLNVERYYHLENTADLHFANPADYYERFLEVFTNAVKVRLRSLKPVASTLSGGLDSGSVSAIAAKLLKDRNQKLKSYCSVPFCDIRELDLGPGRFGDERPYAQATADFSGNIDLEFIRSESISVIDSIHRHISVHGEPGQAAGNWYWIQAILEQASTSGYGTLLTGQGGNATISWTGLHQQHNLETIFKKLKKREISTGSALKQSLRILLPAFLFTLYHQLRTEPNPWTSYSAINIDYVKKIDLTTLMKQSDHDPHFRQPSGSRQARFAIINPGISSIGSFWQDYGSEYCIEVRDPSFDTKLMEFCISVPDQAFRSDNHDRFLLRKSMEYFLPAQVLWNKKRGRQAADLIWRLRHDRDTINYLLNEFKHYEEIKNLMNVGKMKSGLKNSISTIDQATYNEAVSVLLRGLGVGLFIITNTTS